MPSLLHKKKSLLISICTNEQGCGERVVAVESQLLQLLKQAAGQVALGDCEGLFERAASGVKATTGSREGYLYGDSAAGESSGADVSDVSEHFLDTALYPSGVIYRQLYLTNYHIC